MNESQEPTDSGAPAAQVASPIDVGGTGEGGLAFVMDVPVEVTVEIGRRKMRIAEILRLGTGAVLELSKASDEPLDIYVNNRPIARGEAVVVGDHYGIRVTEVLTAEQVRDRTRGGA